MYPLALVVLVTIILKRWTLLSLKQLKGLVNTYDDKMFGIMLGLKNNSNNIITIKISYL